VSLDNAFALIEGYPETSQPVKDAPPACFSDDDEIREIQRRIWEPVAVALTAS
jgi:hypothetical protein